MTTYTFDQLKEAITACTGYDLITLDDDEHVTYALIDPFGDQDGDEFFELDDVADYVLDNEQVNTYLKEEFQ